MGNKRIDLSLAKGTKNRKRIESSNNNTSPKKSTSLKRGYDDSNYEEERSYKKQNVGTIVSFPMFVIHTALNTYAKYVSGIFSKNGINIETQYINSKLFQQTIDEHIQSKLNLTKRWK
jgi:hypothetical protein